MARPRSPAFDARNTDPQTVEIVNAINAIGGVGARNVLENRRSLVLNLFKILKERTLLPNSRNCSESSKRMRYEKDGDDNNSAPPRLHSH